MAVRICLKGPRTADTPRSSTLSPVPLRVSAIAFLNPAPLLYNFEHEPFARELRSRYQVHYTSPAECAAELHSGAADLGLIPIAELTSRLHVVPGCTIASLGEVRSILLLVKNPRSLPEPQALQEIRTLAADIASRSSVSYLRTLLKHFYATDPLLLPHPADPLRMLATADAALIIGDPALLAREHRASIDAASPEPLLWLDLAQLWRELTGRPWVAAVWAVRPEALLDWGRDGERDQLATDLNASRTNGLRHIDELVSEWTPRLAVPPSTIRRYLTENIHYDLDPACLDSIRYFRRLAAELEILPPLPELPLLEVATAPVSPCA